MNTSDMKTLFDYTYWATGRILDQVEQLSPEQFLAVPAAPVTSLRHMLVHMLAAERLWRVRWQTGTSDMVLRPEEVTTPAVLRQLWRDEERAMRAYLATVDDAALAAPVRFQRRGAEVSQTLWHLMFQLVNHGTQHRSEAAVLLTSYGYSPGDLDFYIFVLSR